VSDTLARLRLDYRSAFVGYLSRRGETQLNSAYEIGRTAILAGVGLLDLIQIHNGVVLDLMRSTCDGDERLDVAAASATFQVEVLAAFEMTQRGFLDTARRIEPELGPTSSTGGQVLPEVSG
jgi:hypothetical protein